MSAEQSYQQTKQVAVLPPELSTLVPESGPEPEPLQGSEQKSEHPPEVTQEPEHLPQEEIKEHQEKKDLSSQPPPPDTEPVLQSEETKLDTAAGHEEEPSQQVEKHPNKPLILPRALSQETTKPDHPATKEADGHQLSQQRPPPPPPVEQKHQQKKPPTQWPLN